MLINIFLLQEFFWNNEKQSQVLKNHWDIWFPSRTRLELGVVITCLVQSDLQIFCGLKNGKIFVYDQNLWRQAVLCKFPALHLHQSK